MLTRVRLHRILAIGAVLPVAVALATFALVAPAAARRDHGVFARGAQRAPARRSSGCGSPAVAGTTTEMLDVAGAPRQYRLAVPSEPTGKRPLPLILNFHGVGANSNDAAARPSTASSRRKGRRGGSSSSRPTPATHLSSGTNLELNFDEASDANLAFTKRSSTTPRPASASTCTVSTPPAFRRAPLCRRPWDASSVGSSRRSPRSRGQRRRAVPARQADVGHRVPRHRRPHRRVWRRARSAQRSSRRRPSPRLRRRCKHGRSERGVGPNLRARRSVPKCSASHIAVAPVARCRVVRSDRRGSHLARKQHRRSHERPHDPGHQRRRPDPRLLLHHPPPSKNAKS